ncbi:hypothetical protein MMC24_005484 [Lignoscripta atroalba]|nr:hypothetical protein [Lignoscripta atroalba]
MASSGDTPKRDSPTEEEENPFIAFRRLMDEQMSSLLQSVIGITTALTAQLPNQRWPDYDEEARRRELEGCARSSTTGEWERQRAGQANGEANAVEIPVKRYSESHKTSGGEGEGEGEGQGEVLRCPYRPVEQCAPRSPIYHPISDSSGTFPRSPILGATLPFMRGEFSTIFDRGGFVGVWPMAYVLFSPYSPLQLELQGRFREHGAKWRNAFEDLIAIQTGKEMPDHNRRPQHYRSTDWVDSMIERGMFDGRSKTEHRQQTSNNLPPLPEDNDARHPVNDTREDTITELDLYEQFLASQYPPILNEPAAHTPLPPVSSIQSGVNVLPENAMPSIISTLTTTERKTLPDGTVHTKVLLKKRFADGREESSETVHTTQGTPRRVASTALADKLTTNQPDQPNQENNKKGWFWS